MSEEVKQETVGGESSSPQPPKRKRTHRRLAVLGVLAAVIVVAGGAGLWWHEQPSFCAAFCHNMDSYLETYSQDQNASGVDKYGNTVESTAGMMAVVHRQNETTAMSTITCLNCHEPTLQEQASEGIAWVSGNYYDPLTERSGAELQSWKSESSESFCANENCHSYLLDEEGNVNREKLADTTADMEFNPHDTHHANAEMQCTTCHKGHRESVLTCTGCHEHENEAVPEGWVSAQEGDTILEEGIRAA